MPTPTQRLRRHECFPRDQARRSRCSADLAALGLYLLALAVAILAGDGYSRRLGPGAASAATIIAGLAIVAPRRHPSKRSAAAGRRVRLRPATRQRRDHEPPTTNQRHRAGRLSPSPRLWSVPPGSVVRHMRPPPPRPARPSRSPTATSCNACWSSARRRARTCRSRRATKMNRNTSITVGAALVLALTACGDDSDADAAAASDELCALATSCSSRTTSRAWSSCGATSSSPLTRSPTRSQVAEPLIASDGDLVSPSSPRRRRQRSRHRRDRRL